VISAILVFGDVYEAREDGIVAIRLSPERLAINDLQLLLGADETRFLNVTVLWDERQEQVVGVTDSRTENDFSVGVTRANDPGGSLQARPIEGDVDFTAMRKRIAAMFPKTLAKLAE